MWSDKGVVTSLDICTCLVSGQFEVNLLRNLIGVRYACGDNEQVPTKSKTTAMIARTAMASVDAVKLIGFDTNHRSAYELRLKEKLAAAR
jgi:hypothetical protein